MNTVKINKSETKMIAHRGVSGLEKENTLAAFIAAGNRSYWGVETDIHRTRDGRMIVFHDDNAKRVAGEDLVIEETNYETLRGLTLFDLDGETKRIDLHMPSLKEYIRICKKYGKICVLELKNAMEELDICRVIEEIREEEYLDQVVFISFNTQNLIYVRKHCKEQRVQQLSSKMTEEIFEIAKREGFDLDIYYKELSEDWIRRAHEAGMVVNCWTVNEKEDAERLVAWGIDQITTNILE